MLRDQASMTVYRRFFQKRSWLACLLVVALLFAHAAGLSHMIRHGPHAAPAGIAGNEIQAGWSSWATGVEHSCVLFDAASLGAGPPIAAPGPACHDAGRHALASAVIDSQPDLSALIRFLSRAPPSIAIAA